MPQDKCEEAVDLLVSKECSGLHEVEALPAPVCEILKNKEVVDMICSKATRGVLPAFVRSLRGACY